MPVETIAGDLPPEEWDKLAERAPLFASSPWLRAVRGRAAGEPHYFLSEEGSGDSAGLAAVLCSSPNTDDAFNLYDLMTGEPRTMPLTRESAGERERLRERNPGAQAWFPNLVVALPSAECIAVGATASSKAIDGLVGDIVEWGRERDLAAVTFAYLKRTQASLSGVLAERGFTRMALTYSCDLQLTGSDFDDYLASFSKHRRQTIRREIRTVEQSGVAIRRRRLEECLEQLLELRLALKRKYGRTPNEDKERRTFTGLMENFSDDALNLFTAETDGRVLGFGLDLVWDGVWNGVVSGTDHSDPRSNFISFELDFYSPIKRAYEIGVKDFKLGIAAWEAKVHRGARLVPMDAWTLALDPRLSNAVEESASLTRLRWDEEEHRC